MQQNEISKNLIFLADLIVKTRKSMGLTQKETAHKVGIDYRHFQDIEKGKVDIRVSTLLELQKNLNLNLSALLDPSQNISSPLIK